MSLRPLLRTRGVTSCCTPSQDHDDDDDDDDDDHA